MLKFSLTGMQKLVHATPARRPEVVPRGEAPNRSIGAPHSGAGENNRARPHREASQFDRLHDARIDGVGRRRSSGGSRGRRRATAILALRRTMSAHSTSSQEPFR
jgi:hypothetical protein